MLELVASLGARGSVGGDAGRVRPSCVRESEAIIPDDTSVARCSADEYAEAAVGPSGRVCERS